MGNINQQKYLYFGSKPPYFAESVIVYLFDCSNGEVLTLEQAFSEKTVVYFCLQPLAYPAYAKSLGKIIINDLKALAAIQLQGKT